MTSLQGPLETSLGKNLPISANMGSILILSSSPCGDFTSMKYLIRSAISSSESTSSANRMRRSEPNWLISSLAPGYPLTFSKSKAGPPGPCLPRRSPFGDPIGDLGDLKHRIGFRLNALQLSRFVERGDPISQVVVGQATLVSVADRRAARTPFAFGIGVTDDYSGATDFIWTVPVHASFLERHPVCNDGRHCQALRTQPLPSLPVVMDQRA